MDEFQIIDHFFKSHAIKRAEVLLGIGDDCAVLSVPQDKVLLVSTDTLVSGVHFLPNWDPGDIAYKAVMVNISDCAAMAGQPLALSLALTLPENNLNWLSSFSKGLHEALHTYQIALIGGDLTKGPLTITITIHGLINKGQSVTRSQAKPGDKIYVSGPLGLAGYTLNHYELAHSRREAYDNLKRAEVLNAHTDDTALMKRSLYYPLPRLDLNDILRQFASSAIDISDGLVADLNHICKSSQVGACLVLNHIPVHPLLSGYTENSLEHALYGGDDYELCFTIPAQLETQFLAALKKNNLSCYRIGEIDTLEGIRDARGKEVNVEGYRHF